jgi:hypothetical protein
VPHPRCVGHQAAVGAHAQQLDVLLDALTLVRLALYRVQIPETLPLRTIEHFFAVPLRGAVPAYDVAEAFEDGAAIEYVVEGQLMQLRRRVERRHVRPNHRKKKNEIQIGRENR